MFSFMYTVSSSLRPLPQSSRILLIAELAAVYGVPDQHRCAASLAADGRPVFIFW